jgi:hypothetical protein
VANLDITELLLDTDLVDPMVILRRTPRVDKFGENRLREQGFNTFGSVQPASGKTLQRIPDALRVAGVMSFFIKGQIVSDGQERYPDILVFRGSRYAVQVVFDWSNWGLGWCEGTCVREKPAIGGSPS